jgi:hypothetical protein
MFIFRKKKIEKTLEQTVKTEKNEYTKKQWTIN